jgi:hypothetical protein
MLINSRGEFRGWCLLCRAVRWGVALPRQNQRSAVLVVMDLDHGRIHALVGFPPVQVAVAGAGGTDNTDE